MEIIVMSKDYEVFKGKKLSDLFEEIHTNSGVKRVQIDSMLSHLTSMITNPDDAVQLVPVIKDYMEVAVKNDEQLIKIAGIVGRILQAEMKGVNDEGLLTDLEKEQLMKALEDEVNTIQLESDKIKSKKKSVDDKISKFDSN